MQLKLAGKQERVVFNPLHLFNPLRAGEYFPSDAIVGYAVDALIGHMIPVIYLD